MRLYLIVRRTKQETSVQKETKPETSLNPAITALLDVFLRELRRDLGDDLLSLALYGSFARGDYVLTSDLDLIIVLDPAARDRGDRIDLILPAILRTQESAAFGQVRAQGFSPDFSPLIYYPDELRDTPSVFIAAATDGIILHDAGVLAQKFAAVRNRLNELGAKRIQLGDRDCFWLLKPDLKPGEVFEI
jgi:hypothetical protein